MTPEEIAAAEEADDARLAASFRTTTESELAACSERLNKLESGASVTSSGTDEQGNSLAGMIRTFEARILQVESVQADNASNILRLGELVQTQIGGLTQRITDLENQVKALQPTT